MQHLSSSFLEWRRTKGHDFNKGCFFCILRKGVQITVNGEERMTPQFVGVRCVLVTQLSALSKSQYSVVSS